MNPQEVIGYWYSDRIRKRWFSSTPELDAEIREKYEPLWISGVRGELDGWRTTAAGCLALVLVFDQFPLNMFRGQARSFQTEARAREVAREALNNKFDTELEKEKLPFLFMPFMHSEQLEDQDLAVALFERYGLNENLRFALHHREIVRKFGRFPHRNEILGRENTPEEREYLASKSAFRG